MLQDLMGSEGLSKVYPRCTHHATQIVIVLVAQLLTAQWNPARSVDFISASSTSAQSSRASQVQGTLKLLLIYDGSQCCYIRSVNLGSAPLVLLGISTKH